MCSEEFLEEEIIHIYDTFTKRHYPKGYLIRLQNKAKEIKKKSVEERRNKNKNKRSEDDS